LFAAFVLNAKKSMYPTTHPIVQIAPVQAPKKHWCGQKTKKKGEKFSVLTHQYHCRSKD
jgi:hypothetical protein